MQYFIFLLLFLFLVFLFTLFALCRDDFVLFRKNIDMEKVFNLAFIIGIVGLFFSRFFYVVFNFKPIFLNPLAFSLFPYFPGLSLPGGLLGASLCLAFLLRGKKYPEGRMFDFFILAFSIALLIGQLILFITLYFFTKQWNFVLLPDAVGVLLLFLASFRVFKNHGLKEGSVGLSLLLFISIGAIISAYFSQGSSLISFYKEIALWIIILLTSLVFFLKQESPLSFLKFLGKK
jgi:hypothetical protein